uniref:Uncharacterized protein n=1 Tax=Glossina austeni TaxID=7395 RepID=A0A1A9VLM6_GLOAU
MQDVVLVALRIKATNRKQTIRLLSGSATNSSSLSFYHVIHQRMAPLLSARVLAKNTQHCSSCLGTTASLYGINLVTLSVGNKQSDLNMDTLRDLGFFNLKITYANNVLWPSVWWFMTTSPISKHMLFLLIVALVRAHFVVSMYLYRPESLSAATVSTDIASKLRILACNHKLTCTLSYEDDQSYETPLTILMILFLNDISCLRTDFSFCSWYCTITVVTVRAEIVILFGYASFLLKM